MIEKLICIIFAFGILGQAYLFRLQTRTWLSPACLYGLFWFGYTALPLMVTPVIDINPLGVIYIFFSCLIFSVSSLVFNWKLALKKNKEIAQKINYNSKIINFSFYFFGILSILSTVINWGVQGVSYYDILFNLLDAGGEYMSKRYSGELQSSIASQLSIVLTYPTAILGGILYGSRVHGDKGLRFIFLAIGSAVLMMLVEAAKGALFLVLVLFWAGFILANINRGRVVNIIGSKALSRIAVWVPVVIGLTVVSFLARGIDTDAGYMVVLQKLSYYFLSYSSGHIYAFSDWFSSITTGGALMSYASIEDSNGFYTFMSIFKLLGTSKIAPAGVYDEYYYFEDLLQTNIYTHYRGLILDFGIFGSMILMLLAGALSNAAFYFLLVKRKPWFAISFYAHLLGYFYTSFIISILIWNSMFASYIVVAAVLMLNEKFIRTSVRNG